MKIETTKLTARGNHETVLAKRIRSGNLHAKTYVNRAQATAAAEKVGGEVIQPMMSRCFYVRMKGENNQWKPVRIESAMQSHPLVKLALADEITTAYIEMNGRTYYIDDSTGESIMDNWAKGEGRNQ